MSLSILITYIGKFVFVYAFYIFPNFPLQSYDYFPLPPSIGLKNFLAPQKDALLASTKKMSSLNLGISNNVTIFA